MIGLDTSHVPAFANLLHDSTQEYHVPGGRIVAAYPGGSPDFALSLSRVEGYTAELRDKHGVEIVESIAELRNKCDAVMLESVDGRVHLEQFREVAGWGGPVFIDKPLAKTAKAAAQGRREGDAGRNIPEPLRGLDPSHTGIAEIAQGLSH